MYPLEEGWFVLLVLGVVCLFGFGLFLFSVIVKTRERKYFKSFIGVEPPKRKDKKMISFMQTRVDSVMIVLARDIQKAIDQEESFLMSNEKNAFDNAIFEHEECKKNKERYQNICRAIVRTKKIFWKLHKIIKSYGFATKDSFKDYFSPESK
ncbi:MAG: hypothetical protein Athens071416_382 [Parcubacteria group bacterium Athens0714_16]|nr:MAG: hypothetical protein Athens071416_382 [Parcubacteria group bacterium Athens0714_16]